MLKFFVCFAGTILQWNLPWLELELLSQHRMWHSGLPRTFTLSREIATSCLKVRNISTTAFLEKSCFVCLYLMNLSNCCTQAWSVMSEKNLQYKSFRTNTSEKGTKREIIVGFWALKSFQRHQLPQKYERQEKHNAWYEKIWFAPFCYDHWALETTLFGW